MMIVRVSAREVPEISFGAHARAPTGTGLIGCSSVGQEGFNKTKALPLHTASVVPHVRNKLGGVASHGRYGHAVALNEEEHSRGAWPNSAHIMSHTGVVFV
jgi:hypothetical protein